MNFIKKMIVFIKNIFNKQEEIKTLEAPKQVLNRSEKEAFTESLRVTTKKKRKQQKVETLICPGDGLGIQKKMSY